MPSYHDCEVADPGRLIGPPAIQRWCCLPSSLIYTMRQASRRSWRIEQTRPVEVAFMAYRGTLRTNALKLVAKKLQSWLAAERSCPRTAGGVW